MYHVRVYSVDTGEAVDERSFKIGDWQEIGYWLDYYAYIAEGYRYEIKVTA